MEKPHKKIKKNEFVKLYLSEIDRRSRCDFCKYNPGNYTDMDETLVRMNNINKCIGCIHLPQNIVHKEKISKKRKLFNNFKPLYGWENITK